MFNEVVCQKYRLQVLSQNLKQRLLKLAQDIISLGYDAKTEKSLLSLMENAYNDFKAVTAATDWEENIKKNKEKQEKLRKERQERNLKAKQAFEPPPPKVGGFLGSTRNRVDISTSVTSRCTRGRLNLTSTNKVIQCAEVRLNLKMQRLTSPP
jgi:hypothetical protein